MRPITNSYVLALAAILNVSAQTFAGEDEDFFEKKIRPILVEHCYACHSAQGADIEGGLRLDSRDAMRRGGESGPAVVPKSIDGSLIIDAIEYGALEMPPETKLPADVVADFRKWVESGAVDPREEEHHVAEELTSEIDYEQGALHWAFQQPHRHPLPGHSHQAWCNTRIDHFVASALDDAGLAPSRSASDEVLLRRLTTDLTGLPPSRDLLDRIDRGDDGKFDVATTVDLLLSSPAFGEHWARLWLDVMRFAEDQAHIVGNNRALCYPNSHLYRDWAIEAFNEDMPYDEFVSLQLAADHITPDDLGDDVALGFMGLGPKYYRRNSPEVMADEWEDRIDTLSRGLLGLTVACARCHDHKYDPIGTEDYYALAGIFASTEMYNRPFGKDTEADNKGQAKDPAQSLHVVRDGTPKDLSVLIRGDVNRKGPVVERRFLRVFGGADASSNGSGRLELAQEVASTKNPLTARVWVNRVWAQIVGQPLVATTSNFGALGELPTHPELLDDLSVRFMENGWSLKWLCREIVLSSTYQQSSASQPDASIVDQGNRLLWRMNRKRLSVEQLRDAILSASETLDCSIGGASMDPSDPESTRRTLYSEASRLKPNPMLALFDYPDPNAHSARRAQTTTPTQKLFLINSKFMIGHAQRIASATEREYLGNEDRRSKHAQLVMQLYRRIFAREALEEEVAAGVDFLSSTGQPLATYAHALLATNEMLFVD